MEAEQQDHGHLLSELVGAVAISSARAEFMLTNLFVGLMGTQRSRVFAARLNLANLIADCRALVEDSDVDDQRDLVLAHLDELDELREKRNRIVHDMLAFDQGVEREGMPTTVTAYRRLIKGMAERQSFTLEEIDEVVVRFLGIEKDLMEWAYRNFPVLQEHWGEEDLKAR